MKKQTLIDALEIVKPGLASKEMIEQSTSFAFIGDRVVTYNDEISISHPVEGLELTGAVQATELYLILKKIKQDEFELEIKDNEIHLTAGRTKVGLTLQAEIKLPIKEIGEIEKWKRLPEGFLDAMKMAMLNCGVNNSEPKLTCVHVNKHGYIEGSDGYRVMRTSLDEKFPFDTFLIPSNSVNNLLKISPTKIAIGMGWVHFKSASGTVLSCRTFEDNYPSTDALLDVKGKEFTFPKTINSILDRASVFKTNNGETSIERVSVSLHDNLIKVKSSSDTGWFSEEANVKYDGKKLAFEIMPSVLKNILLTVRTCKFNGNILKFEGENWKFITAISV
jgi:DNA polymerase III sliding clamp (beta) subunit (PCNA family)